jgi:hypothetical protein
LKHAPAPPWSHGQRPELVRSTSPRWLPYHCAEKAGNIYSASLYICRVVLLLLRHRRGAAGYGLGATIKCLRQATSGAAGNELGRTIKYLRGAAGINLGTTIKYLRSTTRQRPGHHDQVPAMHNERRRGKRTWHNDQVPARRRGHRPVHHDLVPATNKERRRGKWPGTTIKHLRRTTSGTASAPLSPSLCVPPSPISKKALNSLVRDALERSTPASEAVAGLDGKRRGKVSANLTSKAHRRVVYFATVQMRASSGPKHTRTEGRAPVWGSEFTTKGRYRDVPRCEAPR